MRSLWLAGVLSLLLAACAPLNMRPAPTSNEPDVVARLPLSPEARRVRVVVIGDQGKGGTVQAEVAQAMQAVCAVQGCDLGLALGDNFYPAGPNSPDSALFDRLFRAYYAPLGFPFLVIAGNHDESWLIGGDGANGAGADAEVAYSARNPQWVMPARTYRALLGSVAEVFALDTTPLAPYLPPVRAGEFPGGPWDQAQRAWLTGALGRSQAPWKLVLGHHPLFSNGQHGEAGRYDQLPFDFQRGGAVRETYLLACTRADLILSGHVHALELLPPQPDCPGTWQLVSGAAGEAGGPGTGTREARFRAFGQPGFAWLELTPDTLTVRFYTLDRTASSGVRLGGETILHK